MKVVNSIDKWQALHDKLQDQITGECETLPIRDVERDRLLNLIWRYGDACIKLVEAEHAETKA